jgi:predicted phosphodiesterase
MKIAIVSDIHIGDEQCALVDNKTRKLKDYYQKFQDSVGQGNDFLVLTGDILDFSVSLYQDTYECARTFFKEVLKDGLAKQFIYLPGNHDTNVWHTVEHETNIINQMGPGQQVRQFRHSVPAILDDRQQDDWDKFLLYGVNPRSKKAKAKYGGLYLDQLIDGESVFNVAHPNLYLVSDDGKGTLITHGHYFEQYWTMASWLALAVARDDLAIGALDVNELVGINFPLVQLACTGIGQSGPLNPVINDVQKDVKSGGLLLVRKYLSKLKRIIDDYWDFERFDNWLRFLNIKEKLSDKLLDFMEDYVLNKVKEISESEGSGARGNEKYQYQPDIQKRIGTFYLASLVELKAINDDEGCILSGLPEPDAIVFGHTHVPRPWEKDQKLATLPFDVTGGRIIQLMNCGGWLKDENDVFRGANVIKYETGTPR